MGDLKLFIWEDSLSDFTTGLMFAYAESAEEARCIITSKMGYIHDDVLKEPREVKSKEAFFVYGSM